MISLVVLADLHGFLSRFKKARQLVEEGIKTVFLAGDIAAAGPPDYQQANVRSCFEILLAGKTNVTVYAIPGNDDWRIVEESMRQFPEVTVPTDRAYPLDDVHSIIGYPYVPITPFMFKDYEKWDDDRYPEMPADPDQMEGAMIAHRLNLYGYRSRGSDLNDFRFDPGDRTDSISADMKRLARLSDPKKTVYLFHCPPYGQFDFGFSPQGRIHIGSRAIGEFIRENRPWLTIHGHCHEAVSLMKGNFSFRIGAAMAPGSTASSSLGISVGAGNDPTVLNGVLVDIASLSLRRITL